MRHPGMLGEFLDAGRLCGINLEIPRAAFDAINAKHFGPNAPGTVLHDALKPVVKAIRAVTGKDLSECGGCAKRQLALNSALSS